MGEVWKAQHLELGTVLAIKLVDTADRDNSSELLARFELETHAAAQIRSPHVVEILDHGVDDEVAFMVMELLEGESLAARLERRGKLPPDEVAYVLSEVAQAIEQAHAAGVIHRDLTPSNIFLARQPGGHIVTKVLDFGVAKVQKLPGDLRIQTQAGAVIGTPLYMSPEQVLGKVIDGRSDLWALSVIAFECIAGQRPIDGENLAQILMQICAAPLPVPSSIAAVPPAFDAWFQRGTERDPDHRFQTAAELAAALRASVALSRTGSRAELLSAPRAPRSRASGRWIVSLLGLLVILGAIGIYWRLSVSADRAPSPAPGPP